MKWGLQAGPWGLEALWGLDSGPGGEEFCALAEERVLIQMDDAPTNRKFRDLVCIFVEALGDFKDVADDVAAAFDLDSAIGEQLDFIGAVVGLPRQGFSDTRYRTFLQIQVDLLLSAARDEANWTGTHNNILKICRTFIGPGPDPIVLKNFSPYSFTLDVPGLVLSELEILLTFICKAIYAGVLGQVTIILASDSLWDSDSVGPIPDGGIWCSDSVVVNPCATWNFTIAIGTQPCD